MEEQKNPTPVAARRLLTGKVISDKMDKTVVVSVERTFTHPRLKKVMRVKKNYKVHDEHSQAKLGDLVKIFEGRPQSKTKYMYLSEVLTSTTTTEGNAS